jgi:cation transport protein ChaC
MAQKMSDDMWVFGYGSLIWNPEFPVAEQHVARATGWHRSFCMRSIHHRGTDAAPGLVLVLAAGHADRCSAVVRADLCH